jgi:hypothetical protein
MSQRQGVSIEKDSLLGCFRTCSMQDKQILILWWQPLGSDLYINTRRNHSTSERHWKCVPIGKKKHVLQILILVWYMIRPDLQSKHLWVNLQGMFDRRKTYCRLVSNLHWHSPRQIWILLCQPLWPVRSWYKQPRKPSMSEALRRVPKKTSRSASFEPAQSKRTDFDSVVITT